MLENYLERIAQPTLSSRRDGLLTSLKAIGVDFEIRKEAVDGHNLINITVPMHHNEMPYILVTSNYDSTMGSPGANNNAAAVAISLGILRVFHFIRGRKKQPLPLEFAFFDGHHQHMLGSQVFARKIKPENIHMVINLDLCGIGDMVLLSAGKYVANTNAEKAIRRLENSPHQFSLRMVDILPPSNEHPFEALKIPTASICAAPEDDIVPIVGLAVSLQNDENIALLPGVYQGVHRPELDTLDTVGIDAMRQVMLIVNSLISNMLNVIKADWK